jgi:hypothetical protein
MPGPGRRAASGAAIVLHNCVLKLVSSATMWLTELGDQVSAKASMHGKHRAKTHYIVPVLVGVTVWIIFATSSIDPEVWHRRYYLPIVLVAGIVLGFVHPGQPLRHALLLAAPQLTLSALMKHAVGDDLDGGAALVLLLGFFVVALIGVAGILVGNELRRSFERWLTVERSKPQR